MSGRVFQDDNFDVIGFEGLQIEALLGLVSGGDRHDRPMIVNLKLKGKLWQRFFLDAWIGFWEDWGELIDEPGDDEQFIDYAEKYKLKGLKIISISCRDGQINLSIEGSMKFSLRLIDPKQDDISSEIVVFRNGQLISYE